MKIHVFTFAVPTVFIMDMCSDSVSFPLWAYLILIFASMCRITYTRIYR